MNISYSEKSRIFWIDTANSTYAMMVDSFGMLLHLYYGAPIEKDDFLATHAATMGRSGGTYLDHSPATRADAVFLKQFEYMGCGNGNFHSPTCQIIGADGAAISRFLYKSHQILSEKTELPGLPQAHGKTVQSLEITLEDEFSGALLILRYSIFPDCDGIARSARFVNKTDQAIQLKRAYSALLSIKGRTLEEIYPSGQYGEERLQHRQPLPDGIHTYGSNRGMTGHQYNPSIVLASPDASERQGEAFALFLLYSGSYTVQVESDTQHTVNASIGINDENFCWILSPGESFDTPEAILVYSCQGLNHLSQQCHTFIMEHIVRSHWKHKKRPLILNNWEGTGFNFDDEKIYAIAKEAAGLKMEMLVLDDGWFGVRNNDTSGLGDWFPNPQKLHDFSGLIKRIKALGLQFGLWFEPEMISEDSELYRKHPDYVMQVPGKSRSLGRNQLVLDFSRPEVVDCIFHMMEPIIRENDIAYIKWDCNRNLSEIFSTALPPNRQGEVAHRYMLGVYHLHEMLLQAFPNLLIEGCAAGGGRFDAGMLYYAPQIWCSDDTDAYHRIKIQLGTSMIYPCSTMGAHVSSSPNAGTHQASSIEFRKNVAIGGTFGYELDPCELTGEDKVTIRRQTLEYHKYNDLIREGKFYRLTEGFGFAPVSAWGWVNAEQSEMLVIVARSESRVCGYNDFLVLKCQGLKPGVQYQLEGSDTLIHGSTLMNAGMNLDDKIRFQGESVVLHFIERS